jgi:ubiquinone/menaquinone biosynthesis C-methylase UbiE
MATAFYSDGGYLEHNPTWHEEDSPWKASNILSILADNQIKPASVCEVGCGVGEILRIMCDGLPATHFTGYEVSPQAFERARTKACERLKFEAGDAFADGRTYELAMAIDVFEHVPDYMGFLTEMKKKARYQLYHIPLDMSVQRLLRPGVFDKLRNHLGHIHYFCRESALGVLRDTGHTILSERYTSGSIEFADRDPRKRLVRPVMRAGAKFAPDLAAKLLGGFSLLVLCE